MLPIQNTYFTNLKEEIQAARVGINPYQQSYSRLFNIRYPMSRYILAWAGITTEKANGIAYLYSWLDRHPYVRAVVNKPNTRGIKRPMLLLT